MQVSIFDIDNWREIGATLARNKTRTFLTAFGIFWGTMMLALLWGGAGGLRGMLMRNFSDFSTNMAGLVPQPTTRDYGGYNKGRSWKLKSTDIDNILRNVNDIDEVSGVLFSSASTSHGTNTASGSVMGIDPAYTRVSIPIVYSGRVINDSDINGSKKVVALGKNLADRLFPGEDPLGEFIELNGVYFKIVGVVGQSGEASIGGRLDDSFLIPLTTMRGTMRPDSDLDIMFLTAKPGVRISDIKGQVRSIIYSAHTIHPADPDAMEFFDVSEIFEMVENVFLGVTLLALFVGFGSLMAGIIGVGNIMWIIVKERTHEIGIRRALGAKPSSIITQILSESMLLTSVAGIAGICFASLVLFVVDQATTDPVLGSAHFSLSFDKAVAILAAFMILGTAAGIIPAVKAMRIKPIEALNDK